MPDFPTHFVRPESVPQPKILLPPPGEHEWKAGAVALLATMTPAGQRRALREWAKLDPPFCPPLPGAPPPNVTPAPPSSKSAAAAPTLFSTS